MTTTKGKTGNGETRIYFTCTGKSHNKICTGARTTIYAESLEEMVYNSISEKLSDLKECTGKKQKIANPAINELYNKLKVIEHEENKLADAIPKDEVNSDLLTVLSSSASKLKAEKLQIGEKIEELKSKEVDNKAVINLSRSGKTPILKKSVEYALFW